MTKEPSFSTAQTLHNNMCALFSMDQIPFTMNIIPIGAPPFLSRSFEGPPLLRYGGRRPVYRMVWGWFAKRARHIPFLNYHRCGLAYELVYSTTLPYFVYSVHPLLHPTQLDKSCWCFPNLFNFLHPRWLHFVYFSCKCPKPLSMI